MIKLPAAPPRWLAAAIAICALLVVLLLMAHGALAQTLCGPANKMATAMRVAGNKLAATMTLRTDAGPIDMHIYANPKTNDWIAVVTTGDGNSCAILTGGNWSPGRLPGNET